MRVSESWLRELVDPPVTTRELAQRLTLAGLEVAAIERIVPLFSGVVAGRIVNVMAHPDAERLRICKVDVGTAEPLQIVCGAPNAEQGMCAPTALDGAKLPDGRTVIRTEIRGTESQGMLCSPAELGLGDDASGLLRLPDDTRPGVSLAEYLDLADTVLELEVTPNRGDCLSVLGIAREVAALTRLALTLPPLGKVPAAIRDTFPITVQASAACPAYAGRIIRGIRADAVSPVWLQERLRRSGIRPLHPVVDVGNYVMLELGQPMHAFDLARLDGGIEVRWADSGETIELLDGRSVDPGDDVLVIADRSGPIALAGIMGGQNSAVTETTRDIFLESAFFAPAAIAGRARRFGLHTDASQRFERGVDPELANRALERATRLLLAICGGEPGPINFVRSKTDLPAPPSITLRHARLNSLLGADIPAAEVREILTGLGMILKGRKGTWDVRVPGFRFDLEREIDLIEEIGRIHGLEQIPAKAFTGSMRPGSSPEELVSRAKLRDVLIQRGYQEVITYSFVPETLDDQLADGAQPADLANPISSEMSRLRRSLWPGLLQTLIYNRNRQQERVRIFELGVNFNQQANEIKEKYLLSGLAVGSVWPEQWGGKPRPVDFADVKSDIEATMHLGGGVAAFAFEPARHRALHPGRCARILWKDQAVGWLGELHPEIASAHALEAGIILFELAAHALLEARVPWVHPISRYPAVRRDLAVVVDETVSVGALEACIRRRAPEIAREVRIFDIYRGAGIDLGRKSVALGLILQDSSRTLTDGAVEDVMADIVDHLRQDLGATIRD